MAGGWSRDFAVSGDGTNRIIETARREPSRRHSAVEDSGCDSKDRKAVEAEWEDVLATMGDGEAGELQMTDDEMDTVWQDPVVECFSRSRRCVHRPKRD